MITDQEREAAIALLTRSRQTFLDAIDGVSETQARRHSEPERWTILEYVEHIAVSDDALIARVKQSLTETPREETPEERAAREACIRATPMPRGVNKAPEMLKPSGRFATLPEATAAFLAARERTLAYARTTDANLRAHFFNHTVLGPLDGYQWLVANARHAELHAGHIREIRAAAGYPAA